jgi:hypothetical protein
VTIHSTSSELAPRSFWIAGIATLTMVVSSTVANIPTTNTMSGTTQRPPGAWPEAPAGAELGTTTSMTHPGR